MSTKTLEAGKIEKAVQKIESLQQLGVSRGDYSVGFGWKRGDDGVKIYYAVHVVRGGPRDYRHAVVEFPTCDALARHILSIESDIRKWSVD